MSTTTIQNNLQFNREKVQRLRSNAKEGLTAGFEYAIQPDGTVLAERRWRELHRRPHCCFKLYRPSTDSRVVVSLQTIDSQMQNASRSYQSHQSLPPPPPAAPLQTFASSSVAAGASSLDHSSYEATEKRDSEKENDTFLSPTRRKRNRHNAIFGQHLPTAQNSPYLARKVFGAQALELEEQEACRNLMHKNAASQKSTSLLDDEDEDEMDALFASIDETQLVSRSQPTSSMIPSTVGRPKNDDSFDYGDPSFDYSTSAAAARNSSMPPSSAYNNPYQDNNNHGSSSSYNPFSSGPTTTHFDDTHNNTSFSNYKDDSFASASTMLHNGDDDNAPLCSHNMPCRLLTAKTSVNMGREFYKCSLPEDQACDFFQWADGNEGGGWNAGPSSAAAGEVKDIDRESRYKFGHQRFRKGQREVIENAMAGRDVFVLMPTGGGKSLCYQLPAWCSPGLSVVVSPLLSLIQDQVKSMNKLGVESVFLASTQDYATEQRDINRRLKETTAHGGIKLLYITPEKLNNSQQMRSILMQLYNRNLISRFVIDEAHCLSDWGHDFRPDYNLLGVVRNEFPSVPLMALTATANEKVVNDAIRVLGMRNPYRYVSSFNRPNLHYEVRKKDGKTLDAIAAYIAERPNDCGVIYCLSRRDCENVSEKLTAKLREKSCRSVQVSFYHAELDAHERERRHLEWSNGRISVLCATIAFGMGIDRPDVRYVIHFSMPKSITHYYQESGRAGRDGEKADCILYYAYKDKRILETMITKSGDRYSQATRRKIDQLYTCLRYCEDEFRCRRTMQLEFFGETFDRSGCGQTCDNCKAEREPDRRNMTSEAVEILELLSSIASQKKGTGVTMTQLAELYRGSKSQSVTKFIDLNRLRGYGKGSKYKRPDVDRIMHAMIFEHILVESSQQNKGGFDSDYVMPGENAHAIQSGQRQFVVEFPKFVSKPKPPPNEKTKEAKKTKKKKSIEKKADAKKAAATSSSSQASAKPSTKKSPHMFVIDDSSSDDDSILDSESKCDYARVLPVGKTKELANTLKKLASNWAEEERTYGNNVFYWNIISNDSMKAISHQVPTTIDELKELSVLGEKIIQDYGDRIVKAVAYYVSNNNLSSYISGRPTTKRQKTDSSKPKAINVDDEFGTEIDFEAIEIPGETPVAASGKRKSPYF